MKNLSIKRIFYLTFSMSLTAIALYGIFNFPNIENNQNTALAVGISLPIILYFVFCLSSSIVSEEDITFLSYFLTFRHKKVHFKNIDNIYVRFNSEYNKISLYEQKWFLTSRLYHMNFNDLDTAMKKCEVKLNKIFTDRLAHYNTVQKNKDDVEKWNKSIDTQPDIDTKIYKNVDGKWIPIN